MDLTQYVRDIPDFPQEGIVFKDITPLLSNSSAFRFVIDNFSMRYSDKKIDAIVGIDARGFIFASALAYRMGVGFIPVRKPGKLPYKTIEEQYDLEYGSNTLAIHEDAINPDANVIICDDVIATGGTLTATINLVEKLGGQVVSIATLIELVFLNGRQHFPGYDIYSLIEF